MLMLIDAGRIARRTPPEALVHAIEAQFRRGCHMPVRHHHEIQVAGEPDGVMLLMPAWDDHGHLGVKIANIFPGNSDRGEPAVSAVYLLMDGRTGRPQALLDGSELTARRTAGTSALAARYLARRDTQRMLMVGTGRLARQLIRFHKTLLPQLSVSAWGRTPENVRKLIEDMAQEGIEVRYAQDLRRAVAESDLVSCATLATSPLICGEWVRPGTHIDLVGSFTRNMREADDTLMARASVFVDTLAGALIETGDIVTPLEKGVLHRESLHDLFELCRGEHPGRRTDDEITVFKSVGAAIEDLACALLACSEANVDVERRKISNGPRTNARRSDQVK